MTIEVFNNTSMLGQWFSSFNHNTGGDLSLSLLLLFCFFMALSIGLKLPWEINVAILLPLLLVFVVMSSPYIIVVLGLALFYMAALMARNFWLN